MSLYAMTFACLRRNALAFLLYALAFDLCDERTLPSGVLAVLGLFYVAAFCDGALHHFLTGARLGVHRNLLRMALPIGLLVLPVLVLSTAEASLLPEMGAIGTGVAAYVVLLTNVVSLLVLFGAVLPAVAVGEAVRVRLALQRGRQSAWPLAKDLLMGPVLLLTLMLPLGTLVFALCDSGLLPAGDWWERAYLFGAELAALFLVLLTMAALARAWVSQIAPPSFAATFA